MDWKIELENFRQTQLWGVLSKGRYTALQSFIEKLLATDGCPCICQLEKSSNYTPTDW